jgi:hypothetical protein
MLDAHRWVLGSTMSASTTFKIGPTEPGAAPGVPSTAAARSRRLMPLEKQQPRRTWCTAGFLCLFAITLGTLIIIFTLYLRCPASVPDLRRRGGTSHHFSLRSIQATCRVARSHAPTPPPSLWIHPLVEGLE